jgi:hypothetical protein
MSPTRSFVDFMQEPIGLDRPQAFKQQPLQGPIEHIIPYQDIPYGFVSYPLGCPRAKSFK